MSWEQKYLDLVAAILERGDDRVDRTGVGTRALFAQTLDINLKEGFPAMTTKKLAWKAVETELRWFLTGSSDERFLAEMQHGTRDPSKTTIWTQNAEADYWKERAEFEGDLGRVYGVQWRSWRKYSKDETSSKAFGFDVFNVAEIDQVKELINKLKTNPTDRRMIISAWNVADLAAMALPPCHMMAQFFVKKQSIDATYHTYRRSLEPELRAELDKKYEGQPKTAETLSELGLTQGGELSCQMYQRSVDTMLGLPFNIASYALLTHMLAKVCDLGVDRLILNLGDVHIYKNHLEAAKLQIERTPLPPPTLQLADVKDIDSFTAADISLVGYQSMPAIKMEMAV